MQKRILRKTNYLWLKILIILAVAITAYLMITKQYLILVEIAICIVGGYILYRVIIHKFENPGKPRKLVEQQPEVKLKIEEKSIEAIDLSNVPVDNLIKELTKRGQVR